MIEKFKESVKEYTSAIGKKNKAGKRKDPTHPAQISISLRNILMKYI